MTDLSRNTRFTAKYSDLGEIDSVTVKIWRSVFSVSVILLLSLTSLSISAASCLSAEPNAPKSFGQRQVEQMVSDRPSMKGIINEEGGELYDLVVLRFNNGASGSRVYWDVDAPASGINAEHQAKQDDGLPYVRNTNSASVSGRDKWCLLIFELENLQNSNEARRLHTRATNGSVSREEYVHEVTKLEFEAMLRTKDVLKRITIPGVTKASDPICTSIICMGEDFHIYLKHIENHDHSGYRQRYEAMYSQLRNYGRVFGKMEKEYLKELLR